MAMRVVHVWRVLVFVLQTLVAMLVRMLTEDGRLMPVIVMPVVVPMSVLVK